MYARRGWATFPLAVNAKVPTKGSHGLLDATTDKEVLQHMFDNIGLNIAIRTGEISRLVVVDIDCHEGGPNGYHALAELKSKGMVLPKGTRGYGAGVVSTASGGLHIYYLLPEAVKLKTSVSVIAPGIDIKAEGGSVVAAPSMTKAGYYRWRQLPDKLLPAPAWLIERCKAQPVEPRPEYRCMKPTDEIPTTVLATIQSRLEQIASAPKGQRNYTLNQHAFYLTRFIGKGFGEADLRGWLLNAAQQAEIGRLEAERTIDSALRRKTPGAGMRRTI